MTWLLHTVRPNVALLLTDILCTLGLLRKPEKRPDVPLSALWNVPCPIKLISWSSLMLPIFYPSSKYQNKTKMIQCLLCTWVRLVHLISHFAAATFSVLSFEFMWAKRNKAELNTSPQISGLTKCEWHSLEDKQGPVWWCGAQRIYSYSNNDCDFRGSRTQLVGTEGSQRAEQRDKAGNF